MAVITYKGKDAHPVSAIQTLLTDLMKDQVDYLFVPGVSPYSDLPMPMLISDAEFIKTTKPLAPVMSVNSARQAAAVLKSHTGKTVALLMKPCEKRALYELVKLSQCSLENALIITTDCMGRMENDAYITLIKESPDLSMDVMRGKTYQEKITSSCSVCTEFTSEKSDIHMNIIGCDQNNSFTAISEKAQSLFKKLRYKVAEIPETRAKEITLTLKDRSENMRELSNRVSDDIMDITKFQKIIGSCLNCYNCRTACPVCYCKECVFVTDIFSHMPETLMNRADKKGILKLPTDTTMFHMTRLAHMSHACIGCGQCSSVCPSDIPVADIFKVVSKDIQKFFDYMPGKKHRRSDSVSEL